MISYINKLFNNSQIITDFEAQMRTGKYKDSNDTKKVCKIFRNAVNSLKSSDHVTDDHIDKGRLCWEFSNAINRSSVSGPAKANAETAFMKAFGLSSLVTNGRYTGWNTSYQAKMLEILYAGLEKDEDVAEAANLIKTVVRAFYESGGVECTSFAYNMDSQEIADIIKNCENPRARSICLTIFPLVLFETVIYAGSEDVESDFLQDNFLITEFKHLAGQGKHARNYQTTLIIRDFEQVIKTMFERGDLPDYDPVTWDIKLIEEEYFKVIDSNPKLCGPAKGSAKKHFREVAKRFGAMQEIADERTYLGEPNQVKKMLRKEYGTESGPQEYKRNFDKTFNDHCGNFSTGRSANQIRDLFAETLSRMSNSANGSGSNGSSFSVNDFITEFSREVESLNVHGKFRENARNACIKIFDKETVEKCWQTNQQPIAATQKGSGFKRFSSPAAGSKCKTHTSDSSSIHRIYQAGNAEVKRPASSASTVDFSVYTGGTSEAGWNAKNEFPEERVGLMVAANSGKPGGGINGRIAKESDLMIPTQEEPVIANWLLTECENDQEKQQQLQHEALQGVFGFDPLADDGITTKTQQGIDFNKKAGAGQKESDKYKYAYSTSGRLSNIGSGLQDGKKVLHRKNDETYEALIVFADSVNASKPRSSKLAGEPMRDTMARTYNPVLAKKENYDKFVESCQAKMRAALDAMIDEGATVCVAALLSCGVYAGVHKDTWKTGPDGEITSGGFYAALQEVLSEPVGPNGELRGQYFSKVILPDVPKA